MKIWQRIALFVIVYVIVLTFPWWFSVLVLLGLTVYIPMYLEVLFFGFLFDTVYSSQYSFSHSALVLALVVLVIVTLARPFVRTEKNHTYL